MNSRDWPAEPFGAHGFETHRAHLRSVAYRMLGSLTEADDAVQEAWLRLSRADTGDVRDLRAWLTTVVSRVCLDMLRSRASRREDSLDTDVHVPDPIVTRVEDVPEEHAVLADSIGIALLVVLDTLSPAERLAFVLHDVFAMPFEQIGPILDRSRPPPSNWRAGPGAASAGPRPRTPRRQARPKPRGSARSSRHSRPPPRQATSKRCSPSSRPTWSCAPMSAPLAASALPR